MKLLQLVSLYFGILPKYRLWPISTPVRASPDSPFQGHADHTFGKVGRHRASMSFGHLADASVAALKRLVNYVTVLQ